MSELYTASKAQEVLGNITYNELSRYVERGKIEKIVPPGKKQGFYSKDDVEKLARELEEHRSKYRIVE